MIDGLGFTLIDDKFLTKSSEFSDQNLVEIKEGETNYIVNNRYYSIIIGKDGKIYSWKDKRTKNNEREICQEGHQINKISIH